MNACPSMIRQKGSWRGEWVNITFWTRSYEVRLTALTWVSYSWQTTCSMDYTGSRCCGFRGALSSTSVCDSVNRKNTKLAWSNSVSFCQCHLFSTRCPFTPILIYVYLIFLCLWKVLWNLCKREIFNIYRGGGKSLARPTSLCILFDGCSLSFDASLVICI